MQPEQRRFLLFGLAGLLVVLGAVFWRAVYATLILPVALLLWAFLRLLLSFDQSVAWVLLICMGFVAVVRSLSIETAVPKAAPRPAARPPASRLAAWRGMIAGCARSREERLTMQKSLTGLLLAAVDGEDPARVAAMSDPYAALINQLPENARLVLSQDLSKKASRSSKGVQAFIRRWGSWFKRSACKPPLDPYTAIEDVLKYMEIYLEKPNESKPNNPPVH